MSRQGARSLAGLATALILALAGCGGGSGPGSGSPAGTVRPPVASSTPLGSATLAEVRADIESRYADQLTAIGDGANQIVLQLKPTATAAAAEIVGRYGSAVQVSLGFFPYPPPSSPPDGCLWAASPTVKPGTLKAVIELPSVRISHTLGFGAKVRVTNTGTKTVSFDSGQPLAIYLLESDGSTVVGGSPLPVAGTGLGLKILPGASHEIDAVGGTASCDLRLGYELPDGPYVARAAVEIDGASGAGFFWSDPLAIQLVTK